jgi:5-methylcytosine-specific restriction endonuclease McrA
MRRLLAERDGAACFYCRTPVEDPATQLTFDHYVPACVLPVSELWNLVLACEPCNQAKADAIPWPVVWLLLSITKACATPMQEAA